MKTIRDLLEELGLDPKDHDNSVRIALIELIGRRSEAYQQGLDAEIESRRKGK